MLTDIVYDAVLLECSLNRICVIIYGHSGLFYLSGLTSLLYTCMLSYGWKALTLTPVRSLSSSAGFLFHSFNYALFIYCRLQNFRLDDGSIFQMILNEILKTSRIHVCL